MKYLKDSIVKSQSIEMGRIKYVKINLINNGNENIPIKMKSIHQLKFYFFKSNSFSLKYY